MTFDGAEQLGKRKRDAMLVIDLHRAQRVFTLRRRSACTTVAWCSVRRQDAAVNEQDEELALDRVESRMTAGVRHDAEVETDVRFTGLIPRLTSPSRNDGHLVDLWFGLERRERTCEWDEAFARVAEGWRPDPRQPSHFALFSHPCSSPLIVARQVSADRSVWREIEIEARALVSHVNRAVAERRATPEKERPNVGWPVNGRADSPAGGSPRNWLVDAAQAIRGLVPKPTIPVSQSSSTGAR